MDPSATTPASAWEVAKTLAAALPAIWASAGPWQQIWILCLLPLIVALYREPRATIKEVGAVLRLLIGLPEVLLRALRDLLNRGGNQ